MIKKLILSLLLITCIYAQTAVAPSVDEGLEINLYQINEMNSSGNWAIYNTSNSHIPDDRITSLSANDTLLWIGTTNGIASFDGESWQVLNEDNSPLPDDMITSLFIDDTVLWIGTISNGLASFNGNKWKKYNESNSIVSDDIMCITGQDSLLWVGTWGKGVYSYNGNEWKNYSFGTGSTFNFIESITANDSIVWIGTADAGISCFDGKNWDSRYLYDWSSPAMHRYVNSLCVDGDLLWLGTSIGLLSYDGNEWIKYYNGNESAPDCPTQNNYTNIVLKDNDWMWFGTGLDGLVWYDGENWAQYTNANSALPSSGISSLVLFNDCLWIGTDDGVIKYNKINVAIDKTALPEEFYLNQNHPNPFNPITTISYQLSAVSDVKLAVFDLTGRKIREWSYRNQSAGAYELTWNGKDQNGNPVPSGVYIYRMRTGEFVESKKMVLLK